ncbi:helix-turn-helix domain-containing protein [Lactiplantibacillus sp. WILCCON 0030]|uniref:Helix-turn-helix domain-containing protein n=1 Tax=Lactiplantibacillus brownii TaxID=3069269 RepID=A0ABU1A9A7_9LACO|nr:helix-turn-helix domain-containing protein [Lactiplantibacillus brownii]MDQ7937441.1 helix-turn-helix domain-containing protein [Lactiplantibacillus brownii]
MFADYLLLLFTTAPRRPKALANVLRGKRTVSTLFAGLTTGTLAYLDSWHGVALPTFEAATAQLVADGWLVAAQPGYLQLTAAGVERQKQLAQTLYLPTAWVQFQQADVRQFTAVSQLALQVVSEAVHQQRRYYPITTDRTIQRQVKHWFRQWQSPTLGTQIYADLVTFLKTQSPQAAAVFSQSLTGFAFPGQTDQQLAGQFERSPVEILVMRKDLSCHWVAWLKQTPTSPIAALLQPMLKVNPVSSSAWQTYQDYQSGQNLAQIAQARQLKLSTVREHLLEVAILWPEFPVAELLTSARITALAAIFADNAVIETWQYKTVQAVLPDLDFFWFRLYQIMRCHDAA